VSLASGGIDELVESQESTTYVQPGGAVLAAAQVPGANRSSMLGGGGVEASAQCELRHTAPVGGAGPSHCGHRVVGEQMRCV